jgi:rubrerythrin
MTTKQTDCAHSCKSYCNAIELAALREKEAILQYGALRDECEYPEVKTMLNELIIEKKKSIELLERTKSVLRSKFEVLDQIRDGFET